VLSLSVAAFFYAFVWPAIQWSLVGVTACNSLDSSGSYETDAVSCTERKCTSKLEKSEGQVRQCDDN